MNTEVLKVDHLWKSFGGLQVLEDVSFTLRAGEYLAVIGPNGAGKTTLINILSGELYPTKGRVHIFGHNVTGMPARRRVRLGLARSFQLNNLFLNLTVLDNIQLALQGNQRFYSQILRSVSDKDTRFIKTQELMGSMGLWEKRNLPVTSLSYGEQRVMEIVLSLASEPRVLLLDEPSAGLSAAETSLIISFLRSLPEETAVLFAAHDMDIVFSLAERIMVLGSGQVIVEGKPEEVRSNPRVREIYLGSEEDAQDTGSG